MKRRPRAHALGRSPLAGPRGEAVRHCLEAPSLTGKVEPFMTGHGVDWLGLLGASESMSHGQGLLVNVAADLWFGGAQTTLSDVVWRLDTQSFRRVIEALPLCRLDGDTPGREPAVGPIAEAA